MDYREFLNTRASIEWRHGFEADESAFPAAMKPFQASIDRWACRTGRASIFAGTGLGKTLMQLAWGNAVNRHTGGRTIALCPLAVAKQTVREADKFGIPGVRQCDSQADIGDVRIVVTNYQKLDKFDATAFDAVILDESSILKNYTGKIKQQLCERFGETKFRLCCTATPAPNDHMELGNHAEFLGVMPSNEMLSRWFINDAANVGKYRLKNHARRDFWRWVASWSVALRLPSDITGNAADDEGYILPPLNLIDSPVEVDARGQSSIVRNDNLTATTIHREMRLTAGDRATAVAKVVNATSGTWIVWCHTDYEADELIKRIPDAVEVAGSHPDKKKEQRLNDFTDGKIRVLVSKPSLAGFGLNWQHCHQMAFVGLSYSFEAFHQAVRRCWRFGQTKQVDAHVFYAITEGPVVATVRRKERDFEMSHVEMVQAVRESWNDGADTRTLTSDFGTVPMSIPQWMKV